MDTNIIRKNITARLGKKLTAIVALICIASGSLTWYFLYFIKTPEYSLKIVHEAIKQQDIAKFNTYVDLDNILAKGFDDVASIIAETNKIETPDNKKTFAGFIEVLRPIVVKTFRKNIIQFVETGNWKTKADDQVADNIAEDVPVDKSSFKGIAYSKRDGKVANLGLRILNAETNTEFTLDVVMRQTDAGIWRVSEIANLKDYLAQLKQDSAQMLKKYIEETQPIIDKHNKQEEALLERYNNNPSQNTSIIEHELIPENDARRQDLQQIPVSSAAQELSALRLKEYELYERYLQLLVNKSAENEHERKVLRQQMHDINYEVYLIIKKHKPEIGEFR